jgi:hypothetical protein
LLNTGQQVGNLGEPGKPGGSCEEEPAGTRVGVDFVLDGKEQLWHALYFVDD